MEWSLVGFRVWVSVVYMNNSFGGFRVWVSVVYMNNSFESG